MDEQLTDATRQNQPTTVDWRKFRNIGTVALLLLAMLWPIAMGGWVWITWEWGERVTIWKGDEATGKLPRLRKVDKEDIGWKRYLWYTVAAENAATRWWTSVTAIIGGMFILLASLLRKTHEKISLTWLVWLMVGCGLFAIGLDERFQLHEWLRVLVVRPAGIATHSAWLRPGDITTLIYPLGLVLCLGVLYRSFVADRLARFLLWMVLLVGLLAVVMDILDIDAFNHYPGWVYAGVVEEVAEWEVVALMCVIAWRYLTLRLRIACAP